MKLAWWPHINMVHDMGEMILLSGGDDERTIQEALSRSATQHISPHLAPDRNDQFRKVLVIAPKVPRHAYCHPEHIRFSQCKLREGSKRARFFAKSALSDEPRFFGYASE